MHTLIFVDCFVLDGPDITPELRKDIMKTECVYGYFNGYGWFICRRFDVTGLYQIKQNTKGIVHTCTKKLPKIRAHENLIKYLVHTLIKNYKKRKQMITMITLSRGRKSNLKMEKKS